MDSSYRAASLFFPLALRMPGHVVEHVALVDDHPIFDPGAGRVLPSSVEHLEDAFRNLNGSGSLGLRESRKSRQFIANPAQSRWRGATGKCDRSPRTRF